MAPSPLRLIPFLVALTICYACDGASSGSEITGLQKELQGRWRWVQSAGGYTGDTIVPAGVGVYEFKLDFTQDGMYREYRDGSLAVSSSYRIERGTAFNAADTVAVLRLDSSVFFPSVGDFDEQAIKQLRGDTLVLFGTDSEARYHTFIRERGRDRRVR